MQIAPQIATIQDAVGRLGHLGTLLAHIQLAVDQYPQVLFSQAAFQPLFPKSVALHGVVVTQSLPPLKQVNIPAQLGVICKLTVHSIPSSRSLIKKLSRTSPNREPWKPPLLTGHLLDLTPFTTTLWARPSSQLPRFLSSLSIFTSYCIWRTNQ
ncbi:LOW QUALITY PROTEIN: hypothetical protein QYF61_000872, partial [Mycteria americana]